MEFNVLKSDLILVTATLNEGLIITRVFKDINAAWEVIKNVTGIGCHVAVLVGANFNLKSQPRKGSE